MGLLHILFGIFLDVFAQAVLDEFLDLLDGIATCVADRHLCVLSFCFTLLAEFATAFLGQRRKDQTDRLAVVRRSKSDVRVDDRTLDLTDEFLLPRRDSNRTCVGSGDGGATGKGRQRSVVVDLDRV